MSRTTLERARSAATVTQIPNHVQTNVCLFDGSGLNVDYGSYVAQHDVVYLAPPRSGSDGMPIGDGDLGAMVACPDHLQFQLQKTDLWSDPADRAPDGWRQPSAGVISIVTDPGLVRDPVRFEQRLSLQSGAVTVQSDSANGACQVTTFVSATAGVLVVHYRDQSVRAVDRRVDITLQRSAHLFAIGETAGILQAFRDRRYAMLARATGGARARAEGGGRSSLHLERSRSAEFTLFVAVSTSPKNGDPVAMARSRIEAAMAKGYDRLLLEHKLHWSQFWEKSFVRLTGAPSDTLPPYLENLWYFGMYQQAACSRGFDAPLAHGGLWLGEEDGRIDPAIYDGKDLRAMLANLTASNHLELSVPYVDTYYRILPEAAARTGREEGHGGARFPARFNRFGDDLTGENALSEVNSDSGRSAVCEGLKTGLLIYDAWRHAPDPFFLRERAFPLLRAAVAYALDRCEAAATLWGDAEIRARLGAALRALLWADKEHEMADEMRPAWEAAAARPELAQRGAPVDLHPFAAQNALESEGWYQSVLDAADQSASGFFLDRGVPDLAASARLSGALTAMLLAERPIATSTPQMGSRADHSAFGGAAPGAIHVFDGLPDTWGGALSMVAPGGFRVSAEAAQGRACYVAVKSMLGGMCRIANPWGAAGRARVLEGRMPLLETSSPLLEFETRAGATYVVEHQDMSISRATIVRLAGKPTKVPREHAGKRIGMWSETAVPSRSAGPTAAPDRGGGISRIDRARQNAPE